MKTEVTLRDAFERYRAGAQVWVSRPAPFHAEKTYYEVQQPSDGKVSRSEAWFVELARLSVEGVSFPLNYWIQDNG